MHRLVMERFARETNINQRLTMLLRATSQTRAVVGMDEPWPDEHDRLLKLITAQKKALGDSTALLI